jgi:hypothetical protein
MSVHPFRLSIAVVTQAEEEAYLHLPMMMHHHPLHSNQLLPQMQCPLLSWCCLSLLIPAQSEPHFVSLPASVYFLRLYSHLSGKGREKKTPRGWRTASTLCNVEWQSGGKAGQCRSRLINFTITSRLSSTSRGSDNHTSGLRRTSYLYSLLYSIDVPIIDNDHYKQREQEAG